MFTAESDYRTALNLLGLCAEAPHRTAMATVLLPGLQKLLRCDEVSLAEVRLLAGSVAFSASFPTDVRRLSAAAELWRARPLEHPWVAHYRRTRDPRATLLSSITSLAALHKNVYYADFYRPRGLRYAGYAAVAASPNRLLGIGVGNSASDFTTGQEELLELVRRPLGAIWARLASPPGQPPNVPADAATASAVSRPAAHEPIRYPSLTEGERRVAELVARGLTNQATAASLRISRKAVEQHLTNVYRRLGITSRSQLVLILSGVFPSVRPPAQKYAAQLSPRRPQLNGAAQGDLQVANERHHPQMPQAELEE